MGRWVYELEADFERPFEAAWSGTERSFFDGGNAQTVADLAPHPRRRQGAWAMLAAGVWTAAVLSVIVWGHVHPAALVAQARSPVAVALP